MSEATDLNLATNLFGPLCPALRERLEALIRHPTPQTWEDAYTIVLHGESFTTLWQAVCAIDHTFPRYADNTPERWPRVPTARLVVQAINYATH